MEKYDSVARKQRRIGDSICFWEGKPVYVKASSPWRALAQPQEDEVFIKDYENMTADSLYDSKGWQIVKYTDDRFSAAAPELGYVNKPGGSCTYAARNPVRGPMQGFQQHGIKGLGDIFGKPLADMLMDRYPTFDEAMKSFKTDGLQSIAFSRHFAIQRLGKDQITLQFHDRSIGIWNAEHLRFDLFPGRESKIISPELTATGVEHVVPNH